MTMTPDQQMRLDYLRAKKDQPVRQEPSERPVHLGHAHYGTSDGLDKCACPENCSYCCRNENE